MGEAEVLGRLSGAAANVTVLVVDREDADIESGQRQERLKRDLCWNLADLLQMHTEPELVFWADTDTLYLIEEFERACTFSLNQHRIDDAPHPAPATEAEELGVPEHFVAEPDFTESIADLLGAMHDSRYPDPPASVIPEDDDDEPTLPERLLDYLNRGATKHRAVNGFAMACSSTTIGMSTLPDIHNIFM